MSSTPKVNQSNFIQAEDIRGMIEDESPEDNPLHMDVYFSEEKIHRAMRNAAMRWNAIPPIGVGSVQDPFRLPFGSAKSSIFIEGVLFYLYRSAVSRLKRNDITYDAGGVTTNIKKDLINHFDAMRMEHWENFQSGVHEHKVSQNIRASYRCLG